MQKDLREKLKILRATKNLTQLELGEILGVSDSTLSDYERGKTRIPEDIQEKLRKMLDEQPTIYPISSLYEEFRNCAEEMGWKLTSDDYMVLAHCETVTDYIYGKTCYTWIYEVLSGNNHAEWTLEEARRTAEDWKIQEAIEELRRLDEKKRGCNQELINKISVSKSIAHILKEKYKDDNCIPLEHKKTEVDRINYENVEPADLDELLGLTPEVVKVMEKSSGRSIEELKEEFLSDMREGRWGASLEW